MEYRRDTENLYCSFNCYKQNVTRKPIQCKQCGTEFKAKRTEQMFCSRSCSCTHSNCRRDASVYKKVSDKHKNNPVLLDLLKKSTVLRHTIAKIKAPHMTRCDFCGKSYQNQKKARACGCFARKKQLSLPNLHKYFGLSYDKKGTLDFDNEVIAVIDNIRELYKTHSLPMIKERVGYPDAGNLRYMMIAVGIQIDTLEDSNKKEIERELSGEARRKANTRNFKRGFENIGNKKFCYRSSYELDMIKILASRNINFEMESKRFYYIYSKTGKKRFAIPDFIFEDQKIIVEVKSNFTLHHEEMVDKFKEYIHQGYKPYLWLDKAFYQISPENDFIECDDQSFFDNF